MNSKWDGIEELSHIEYVDRKEMEEIIDRVKGGGEAGEAGENIGTDTENMGTDIEKKRTELEWADARILQERAINKAKTREIKRLNYIVKVLVDSMI